MTVIPLTLCHKHELWTINKVFCNSWLCFFALVTEWKVFKGRWAEYDQMTSPSRSFQVATGLRQMIFFFSSEVCFWHCTLFLIRSTRPSNDILKCPVLYFFPIPNPAKELYCVWKMSRHQTESNGMVCVYPKPAVSLFLWFDLRLVIDLRSCSSIRLPLNVTFCRFFPPSFSFSCPVLFDFSSVPPSLSLEPVWKETVMCTGDLLNSTLLPLVCESIRCQKIQTVKGDWVAFVASTFF